jgi:hypothetical protein
MEGVRAVETPRVLDLAPFQPTVVSQRRTFVRQNLREPDSPPSTYVQVIERDRRIEGSLVGREMKRLADYLLPGQTVRKRPGLPWPAELADHGTALFLELLSPVAKIPLRVPTSESVRTVTELRCYDRHGLRPKDGRLERVVAFEGFETVRVGGETYVGAARLKVDSKVRIRWGPRVDITEYVWLARGEGEVRRIEHVRGLAWLVIIDEVYGYERVGDDEPSAVLASQVPAGPEQWSCIAVHLDRSLPHPRVGGLAVDIVRTPSPVAGSLHAALAPVSRAQTDGG